MIIICIISSKVEKLKFKYQALIFTRSVAYYSTPPEISICLLFCRKLCLFQPLETKTESIVLSVLFLSLNLHSHV